MTFEQIKENGLDIDDWDTHIYRVLSIKYFKAMIKKKELVLMRPILWKDPFENFFLKCTVKLPTGEMGTMEEIQDKWFGLCWTRRRESDAMWRIYSPKKNGVRISTTIRKLFSAVYDESDKFASLKYFIGTVQYWTKTEIQDFLGHTSFMDLAFGGQAHRFARTLCIKRDEFQHECEVRLLVQDVGKRPRIRDKWRLRFDYSSVVEEATLDPRLTDSEFQDYKNDLESIGCTIPIDRSDLYRVENGVIDIE